MNRKSSESTGLRKCNTDREFSYCRSQYHSQLREPSGGYHSSAGWGFVTWRLGG